MLNILLYGVLLCFLGFIFIIARLIYKMGVVPKRTTRFYEAQGIKSSYFTSPSLTEDWDRFAREHGNSLYPWNEFVKENTTVPAVLTNTGPTVRLQLIDPAYAKEFFQREFEDYKKGDFFSFFRIAFGEVLSLRPYEVWKARRRLYSQAFHFDFLKDNLSNIEDLAIRFCNRMHPSKMAQLDIFNESQFYTGSVMTQVFFGKDMSEYKIEGVTIIEYLSDYLEYLIECFKTISMFVFGPMILHLRLFKTHRDFMRRKKVFKTKCKEIIRERELELKQTGASNEKPSLLDIFIKAKTEAKEAQIDDETIVAEFSAFFFAGTDTTSYLIAHACYYIASHHDIRKKLREEISTHWKLGQPLTIDILNNCEYLLAFIKEIHRVVGITQGIGDREAIRDHQIKDLKIQKGTNVVVGFRFMNHNPRFFKNPEKFEPERFLRKDSEELFNTDPYIFIPFSAGRGNCLGQHVANVEIKVVLMHMIMKYDFALPDNYEHKLRLGLSGFLVPMHPMLLKLNVRS